MVEVMVSVITSLEARPAARLVQTASKFESRIQIKKGEGSTVNAKSIMGIISLSILEGDNITITAEGTDEKEAICELRDFFKYSV
ncbi:MAG: HPr family phosphocarrier protein [Clostridiales bacterium]|jgi:phosphotransferase system HPr (HPr) family protein|nr:HPr family phosphocarrier protein [Clostridiales bacterium]